MKRRAAAPRAPAPPGFGGRLLLWSSRWLAPLLLGGLGAAFSAAGGGLLLWGVDAARAEAEAARARPLVTARTLALQPAGARVLMEGRIAPDTPAGFRDFVAYRLEEYAGMEESGNSRRERWAQVELATPPFAFATPGGPVPVTGSGYELRRPPHHWQSDAAPRRDLFHPATRRAEGFLAGDAVLVDATVGGERGSRTLAALVVFGGERTAYLEGLDGTAATLPWLGRGFTALGAVLLLVAAALGWHAARRP